MATVVIPLLIAGRDARADHASAVVHHRQAVPQALPTVLVVAHLRVLAAPLRLHQICRLTGLAARKIITLYAAIIPQALVAP